MGLVFNTAKLCIKDWKRFLLAVLLNLIPVVNILVAGYFLKMIRYYLGNEKEPRFPEWSGWGSLFVEGLKLLIICLIWMVPFGLLGFGVYVLDPPMFLMMIFFVMLALMYLYLLPSIFVFEAKGFKKSFSKDMILFLFTFSYFKKWLVLMVVNFVCSLFGRITPLILAVVSVYLYMLTARLFAQSYRAYTK